MVLEKINLVKSKNFRQPDDYADDRERIFL